VDLDTQGAYYWNFFRIRLRGSDILPSLRYFLDSKVTCYKMSEAVVSAFKSFPQTREQAEQWLRRSIFISANSNNEAQVAYIMSKRASAPCMMYGAGLDKWKVCYFSEAQRNAMMEEAQRAGMMFLSEDKKIVVSVEVPTFYYKICLMQGVGVDEIKPWFSTIKDANIVFIHPVTQYGVPFPVVRIALKTMLKEWNIVSTNATRKDYNNKLAWIVPCSETWERKSVLNARKKQEQVMKQAMKQGPQYQQVLAGFSAGDFRRDQASASQGFQTANQMLVELYDTTGPNKGKAKVSNEH